MKKLEAAYARANRRLHSWVDRQIEQDAVKVARLYRASRGALMERLAGVYTMYLGDEPSYVRARMTGALQAIDRHVDEVVSDMMGEINTRTALQQADMMSRGTARVGRSLKRTGLTFAELPVGLRDLVDSLETTIVAGGTYADRLFHHSAKLRSELQSQVKQSLLSGEDFDSVRARVMKVFGVDKLSTPKSHAYGSVKHYKNAARLQWNRLMRAHAEKADGIPVWFADLDEDSTPGCAARHGMNMDEMDDDTMPHHINCRCQVAVMPRDADLSEYVAEGSAWLQAEGWTRKEAMFEESAAPVVTRRPYRETWERHPGLRFLEMRNSWSAAVVTSSQADHLMMGRDPGVDWSTGDAGRWLDRKLRDTWAPDPIVALRGACDPQDPGEQGLVALVDVGTGAALFEARSPVLEPGKVIRRRMSVLAMNNAGKVLAVRSRDFPHWTLPGGHLEDGERPEDCAVREFGEETGKRVRLTKYLGEFSFKPSRPGLIPEKTIEEMVFEGEVEGQSDWAALPGEIEEVRFVDVGELEEKERDWIQRLPARAAREAAAPETEKFDVRRGERNKIVIAAPHGASDAPTAEIAAELARRLRVSSVVARVDGDGPRINVNRPTEGVGDQGEDPSAERRTPRAERTYRRWLAAVSYAADGGPDLYVEIHDNDFPGTQDALEVATVGVTPAQARMLRHKWEALDTSVAMRVEPVDRLEWNGVVAKRIGIFAKTPRAIQVELPLKFSRQAGAGEHGAIEALKDWLDGAIGVLA